MSLVDSVPIRALPVELTASSSLVVAATRDVATSAGAAAPLSPLNTIIITNQSPPPPKHNTEQLVGEHIPVEFEATLLDNIARHARDGVLLTWAVPNQYGFHHVSERTNEYVIGRMRERGFEYDEDLSAELRGMAVLKWFKNTIMVFHRKA